ncbi:hypothetical protein JX265_001092 [Neoarthrinium moseri]|uniref:Major facilitator superfamily (MFS) profile domain-containing protein n=1 Tax=Neoarthrinium moseri TaxID=1658444 RepID=A0A9Q0ARK8_9PEZI|nr:hypothetical protein JX265_001092 [Neoarthrinium moseri]
MCNYAGCSSCVQLKARRDSDPFTMASLHPNSGMSPLQPNHPNLQPHHSHQHEHGHEHHHHHNHAPPRRNSRWSFSSNEIVLNRLSEILAPFDATRGEASISEYPEDDLEHGPEMDTIPIAPPVPIKDEALYKAARDQHNQRNANPAATAAAGRIWRLPDELKGPARLRPLEQDEESSPTSEDSAADGMSRTREAVFVSTICMAQLCTQAGLGQTLAIIHVVGDTYGISNPRDLSWLIAGYTLTIGTFILIAGRLGDAYGYKRVFLAGFAWSALWAAVAGTAVWSTHVLFTVCRVLQGLGAAMCLPNAIALLGATYPPGKRKSMIFAIFAATAPCGSILGAAGGGVFALVWWPVAYWAFALVLCVVATVGYYVIPAVGHRYETPASFPAAIRDLDIPGAVLGVSALALVSFAFNQGPIAGWSEPYIWMALVVGALLMCIFIMVECHYAANPIIPLNALKPNVSFILGAVACGWGCFGIWSFYTWQFLQVIRRLSPLLTTAWFSPVVIVGILASLTTGLMLHRLGPPVVMTISMLAFTIGTLLIATCPDTQTYWGQTFVCMLVISWGMDMSFPAATLLLSDSVSRRHQGIAASLVSTVINYSISVGIGIGGTVEQQVTNGAVSYDAVLSGYRAALWTGVALASLGVIICLGFLFKMFLDNRPWTTWNWEWEFKRRNKKEVCCTCHGVLDGTTVGSHSPGHQMTSI